MLGCITDQIQKVSGPCNGLFRGNTTNPIWQVLSSTKLGVNNSTSRIWLVRCPTDLIAVNKISQCRKSGIHMHSVRYLSTRYFVQIYPSLTKVSLLVVAGDRGTRWWLLHVGRLQWRRGSGGSPSVRPPQHTAVPSDGECWRTFLCRAAAVTTQGWWGVSESWTKNLLQQLNVSKYFVNWALRVSSQILLFLFGSSRRRLHWCHGHFGVPETSVLAGQEPCVECCRKPLLLGVVMAAAQDPQVE